MSYSGIEVLMGLQKWLYEEHGVESGQMVLCHWLQRVFS